MNELFQNIFEEIAKDGLKSSSISGYERKEFVNPSDFKRYVQTAIYKKSPIRQQKLLALINYYGKSLKDLSGLDFLGPCELSINGKIVKGNIIKTGDGVRGILGSGPVEYRFIELG